MQRSLNGVARIGDTHHDRTVVNAFRAVGRKSINVLLQSINTLSHPLNNMPNNMPNDQPVLEMFKFEQSSNLICREHFESQILNLRIRHLLAQKLNKMISSFTSILFQVHYTTAEAQNYIGENWAKSGMPTKRVAASVYSHLWYYIIIQNTISNCQVVLEIYKF